MRTKWLCIAIGWVFVAMTWVLHEPTTYVTTALALAFLIASFLVDSE